MHMQSHSKSTYLDPSGQSSKVREIRWPLIRSYCLVRSLIFGSRRSTGTASTYSSLPKPGPSTTRSLFSASSPSLFRQGIVAMISLGALCRMPTTAPQGYMLDRASPTAASCSASTAAGYVSFSSSLASPSSGDALTSATSLFGRNHSDFGSIRITTVSPWKARLRADSSLIRTELYCASLPLKIKTWYNT